MADEAFALSPISARAAEPREEDYDAISAAFMETSRGRWFLGEYAKRNRNADTRMVLDAVARIEQNIASQKPLPPDNKLAETLTAIRMAVDAARSTAFDALSGVVLEEKLTPLRKGARIIHEIAWRWREIGADGRICDLLDAQVLAIEASCEEITSFDAHAALDAAFELIQRNIEEKIEGLASGNTAARPGAEASPAPSATSPKPVEESGENTAASARMAKTSETGLAEAATPDAIAETTEIHFDIDDDGYDEAILDAVALEMAIADPVEPKRAAAAAERAAPAMRVTAKFDEINDVEIHFVDSAEEPPAAEAAPVGKIVPQQPIKPQQQTVSHESLALQEKTVPQRAATPEPITPPQPVIDQKPAAAPVMEMARAATVEKSRDISSRMSPNSSPEPVMKQTADVSPEVSFEVPPDISSEMSLGSSLIASGIVKKPGKAPASDPMAAIRRLSQAEKIALFS